LTFASVGGIAGGGRSSTSVPPADRPARRETQHNGLLLFADPVADITVLGAPGNQSLGDECGQYEAFVEALPPFDVAQPPPPRSALRAIRDQPAAFPSVEVAFPAPVLSLDRA
jgi:hypothetical protein